MSIVGGSTLTYAFFSTVPVAGGVSSRPLSSCISQGEWKLGEDQRERLLGVSVVSGAASHVDVDRLDVSCEIGKILILIVWFKSFAVRYCNWSLENP